MLKWLIVPQMLGVRLMYAVQVAIVLWISTLVLGSLAPVAWWLMNWRMMSESLFLLLGILYVWRFRVEVINSLWQEVVARFGIFTYTVTLVWWLLLLVMMVITMDAALLNSYLDTQITSEFRDMGMMVDLAWEALKLYVIGLIPVFGYRWWWRSSRK